MNKIKVCRTLRTKGIMKSIIRTQIMKTLTLNGRREIRNVIGSNLEIWDKPILLYLLLDN